MIFNSLDFLIFAIIFFVLWPFLRSKDVTRWSFITISSFIFYGWWDWRFLFLIVFSGLVDYFTGMYIPKSKNKKLLLGLSLFANLGSLSIFKYSTFFATILQDIFLFAGVSINLVDNIPEFALILPVGISFYTFQSLSYTIDIYRGRLKPTTNILHFFSYLAMFPQLVAGPIVRANDFLSQLKSYRIPNAMEKWNAVKMIIFGLFQKVVIADNLSLFIDSAYEGKSAFDGTFYWWFVAFAFSFQIYNDFSGYSLIARGLAKMMGYHFKMNFNHPYLSTSLKQFWTRWHISLSTWFRDYVYIPLGGSRRGKIYGAFALFTTMMLSGLWHGANYTFLMWAFIHVVFLLLERFTKWNKRFNIPQIVLMIIIFLQATLAWVYFRSDSIEQANLIITKLFSVNKIDFDFISVYANSIAFLALAFIIEISIFIRKTNYNIRRIYTINNLDIVAVSVSIVVIIFFRGEGQQFIYFQF